MTSQREAIIFIHGFYLGKDRSYFVDCLTTGFTELLEANKVEEIGEEKIAGHIGKKFKVFLGKNEAKEVDLYDAYWNDLIGNELSSKSLKEQVSRGIYMLFYWLSIKNFISLRNSPPLLIGLGISFLLWIFWFYGIIALIFVAIGQEPSLLGFTIPNDWSSWIGSFGKSMTNWSVWLVASGVVSFVPINMIANMADFATRYLEENPEGKITRSKIRKQVADILSHVLEAGVYDKITVLASCFGAVIATDVLADYHQDHQIRYITLGTSLKLFSSKSAEIEKEIRRCINNVHINEWIDFYSHQDWLCSKAPVPKGCNPERIFHRENKLPSSLIKQLSGKYHDHYLINEEVLKAALNL
ncbi:hypothetical protein [Nodosilinea nodulosa]|uniref:hypothetical protein n=1 Tax=Nodosilinea nodulosa TaxID=416001 RepID=UPI0002F2661F|nr:hypothetical protein [Nodosilinea nodulosa]